MNWRKGEKEILERLYSQKFKMKGMEVSISKKQNQETYWIIVRKFDNLVAQFAINDRDSAIRILDGLLDIFNHLKYEMD